MKKILLTLAGVAVAVCTIHGQARVSFNNQSTFSPSDTITIAGGDNMGPVGGDPGWGIGGDKYAVQLRWLPGVLSEAAFEAGNPMESAAFSGLSVFLAPTGPLATF